MGVGRLTRLEGSMQQIANYPEHYGKEQKATVYTYKWLYTAAK